MSYFESSSMKRSREDDGLIAAAETVKKSQRMHGGIQMISQPTIVDAIEKPKVGGEGDWKKATKQRAEDGFVMDNESDFRTPPSALPVDFADWLVVGSDDFLLDGYGGGGLGLSLVDYGLVEQLWLGWSPCSDADLMSVYGDGDGGDLWQMSLWEDDIWKLRDIHETPSRQEV